MKRSEGEDEEKRDEQRIELKIRSSLYKRPYGLLSQAGIVTDGMTPREAWNAVNELRRAESAARRAEKEAKKQPKAAKKAVKAVPKPVPKRIRSTIHTVILSGENTTLCSAKKNVRRRKEKCRDKSRLLTSGQCGKQSQYPPRERVTSESGG